MSLHQFPKLLAATLALAALSAQASNWQLSLFAHPNNAPFTGLSAAGSWAVATRSSGDVIVNSLTQTGDPLLGGNSARLGFGSTLGISADGRYVSGSATVAGASTGCTIGGVAQLCDISQAALYDRQTGNWTTLGGLGGTSTLSVSGQATVELSSAYAISASGNAVVGQAQAVVGTGSRLHPFVYRDGQMIDLNPGAAQTGRAQSVSGDGLTVSGYKNSSAAGSIWRWNGSSYAELAAPKANNTKTGAQVAIAVDKLSENGVWAAGSSVNLMAVQYGSYNGEVVYFPTTLWNTETNSALVIPFDHEINPVVGSNDPARNVKATVAGVSNSGVVIGTYNLPVLGANVGTTGQDAWIYNAYGDGKSMTFDSYLASLGLALAPTQHVWLLNSMSADGQAIAGMLYDSAIGASSAFVLHAAAVPEPGTWAQLGLGLLAMGSIARRRRRRD